MKRTLLFLFLIGQIVATHSQNILITSLTANQATDGIAVNVQSMAIMGSGYLSNSYEITGTTIELSVCYWFNNTLPVLEFNNDFLIPLTESGNYTVHVSLHLSTSSQICDYFGVADTGTVEVSFLDTDDFELFKSRYVFANPTKGIITLPDTGLVLDGINVYDNLGRLVKQFKEVTTSELNLQTLSNGMYLMEFTTEKGRFTKKIILKQ